jgi:hypothetical protein
MIHRYICFEKRKWPAELPRLTICVSSPCVNPSCIPQEDSVNDGRPVIYLASHSRTRPTRFIFQAGRKRRKFAWRYHQQRVQRGCQSPHRSHMAVVSRGRAKQSGHILTNKRSAVPDELDVKRVRHLGLGPVA